MAKDEKTIDVYGKGECVGSAEQDLERAVREAQTGYGVTLSDPSKEYHVEYGKKALGVGATYDAASKQAKEQLKGAEAKEVMVTIKSTYALPKAQPVAVRGSGGGAERNKESGAKSCYF